MRKGVESVGETVRSPEEPSTPATLVNAEMVSGAVEKWCITSGVKVWLSGWLSEFLFSPR